MQLHLAEGTSQAHLDGTTTGIVVMMIVMLIALAAFIALVYWSARDPGDMKHQSASDQRSVGAASRPATNAGGQRAPRVLVDHVQHDEETSAP